MYLFHNEILTFVHNLLEKWSLMRINVSAFLRLSETLRSETQTTGGRERLTTLPTVMLDTALAVRPTKPIIFSENQN